MMDYNTHGAVSSRAMMQYSGGTIVYSPPSPLSDGTAGVYAYIPWSEKGSSIEVYISEWISRHNGPVKATFGFELRDAADRVFTVQLVDLDFEVTDGKLIRDHRQMVA